MVNDRIMASRRFTGRWFSSNASTFFKKMSSDEEEPTSPVLPKDSDHGSSVSSELQDEYEELLRYAVVAPKLDTLAATSYQRLSTSHLSVEGSGSQRRDDAKSPRPTDPASEAGDGRRSIRSTRVSPLIVEPSASPRTSHVDEMAGRCTSRLSLLSTAPSDRLQTTTERLRPCSPDPHESVVTELFISEQNISKMGNILDTWSNTLKSNVLTELRKWKLAFMEQHKREVKKERDKFATQSAGLRSEIDTLKGLLQTYETSSQRKDEVISNLSQVLDRQKQKLEKMRAFTQWRLQHNEAKEEAHAAQVAKQHYNLQLKKKVWFGWHSLIQKHWKVKVERACRARAEEVCTRLSSEYEAKLAEHSEALEKAQAEIHRLRLERERYEESMKKAFMRGVCALNTEALNMFQITEAWPEQPQGPDQHDLLPPQEEAGSATLAHLHAYPISSTRFSPLHFDRPDLPLQSEADDGVCSQASMPRTEVIPPTTVVHSSLPLGGIASSNKQVNSRVVTAGQQKPSKTVTARITARSDISKAVRNNLQVMGVAPPMSSVIVERHHPVTQVTIGQATAAKFPRPSQQSHSVSGRSTSKTYPSTNTCHVHSIKVVE